MATSLAAAGMAKARSVAGTLEAAIRRGALPPRYELSIRELAERRGVRESTLVLALDRLIDDRLIFVHGDVAVVSMLRSDESARLNELYGLVMTSLTERLVGAVAPVRLDRLENMVAKVDPDRAGMVSPALWGRTMSQFNRILLKPVVSEVERRTLEQISDANHRYVMLGWSVIRANAGEDRDEVSRALRREHIQNFYQQLDAFRGGSRRAVIETLNRREKDRATLCEASLTRDNTKPVLRIIR